MRNAYCYNGEHGICIYSPPAVSGHTQNSPLSLIMLIWPKERVYADATVCECVYSGPCLIKTLF